MTSCTLERAQEQGGWQAWLELENGAIELDAPISTWPECDQLAIQNRRLEYVKAIKAEESEKLQRRIRTLEQRLAFRFRHCNNVSTWLRFVVMWWLGSILFCVCYLMLGYSLGNVMLGNSMPGLLNVGSLDDGLLDVGLLDAGLLDDGLLDLGYSMLGHSMMGSLMLGYLIWAT